MVYTLDTFSIIVSIEPPALAKRIAVQNPFVLSNSRKSLLLG